MAAGDFTLNVGHLTGLGGMARDANETVPAQRPGTVSLLVDALGFRVFKYIRAIAALTKGQMAQMTGTGVTPFTAFTNTGTLTTSFAVAGLTANDHQGKVLYITDDAGAAGAAPEGEMTVIASNTTALMNFEPELPLSTALANNDTGNAICTYQAEVATTAVFAVHLQGCAQGNNGITAGNYGWVQQEGVAMASINTGTAIALGNNLVAITTGQLGVGATNITLISTVVDEFCAVAYGVVSTDQVANRGPVKLKIFTCVGATGITA